MSGESRAPRLGRGPGFTWSQPPAILDTRPSSTRPRPAVDSQIQNFLVGFYPSFATSPSGYRCCWIARPEA